MTDSDLTPAEQDALKREANDWVMRLTSGEATAADAAALNRWRQTSRAHRRAFAEANLLWDKLRPAAAQSARLNPAYVRLADETATSRGLGRRAFLGGALTAAAAAAAGYAMVKPPLDLWPSLSDMTADYRTGVGQQQQIAFDGNVSLKLNTRTSIAVLSADADADADSGDRIELVAGEAAFTTAPRSSRPFTVVAAEGRTIATTARFNVRHDVSAVCVTCLEGDVRIEHLGQTARLRPREQVIYTAQNLGPSMSVDPEAVTAWERGLLVFRNDPLAHVIDEVNRYRSGKIILTSAELGQRPVLATFRIDRIDEVVPRLQSVFGVQARTLPGGIVLLS